MLQKPTAQYKMSRQFKRIVNTITDRNVRGVLKRAFIDADLTFDLKRKQRTNLGKESVDDV